MTSSYILFGVCVLLALSAAQRRPNPPPNPLFSDCDKCRPDLCPQLQRQACKAGPTKDPCDCCEICARTLGEQCDMDLEDRDPAQHLFEKPLYTPKYGRCGTNLKCVSQHTEEPVSLQNVYTICECQQITAVCGEDGKTYKNKCEFDETMAGRAEKFRIARDEPCDEAPKILSFSQSVEKQKGDDVVLSCEVSGYPTPKIEWTFSLFDRQKTISLPSDHTSKSVQVRGGPDHYQMTSWLQISGLKAEDAGIYSCSAFNKLGKVNADTTVTVKAGREL